MLNNFGKFFRIVQPAFGLDISDSSIKFIQLNPKGRHLTLKVFGEASVPKGIVENGSIKNPHDLSVLLEKVLAKHRKKGLSRYVVASLPDEEVFLKTMELPLMEKKELYGAVQIEAERDMPIQADKSYLDYHILSKDKKNINLLAAAARKDVVDTYASVIHEAGFNPVIIEPEVSAISRSAIRKEGTKNAVIILEIGANRSRVISYVKNSIVLTGSVDFSAREAVNAVAEVLGIRPEEANKMKWETGLLKDKEIGKKLEKALGPLSYRLADGLHDYIGFLNDTYKEKDEKILKVEKIILSGGGSKIPGLEKNLSMILQMPTEMVNPWVNVLPSPLNETPQLDRLESVRYTTAIGLALRGTAKELSIEYGKI